MGQCTNFIAPGRHWISTLGALAAYSPSSDQEIFWLVVSTTFFDVAEDHAGIVVLHPRHGGDEVLQVQGRFRHTQQQQFERAVIHWQR